MVIFHINFYFYSYDYLYTPHTLNLVNLQSLALQREKKEQTNFTLPYQRGGCTLYP